MRYLPRTLLALSSVLVAGCGEDPGAPRLSLVDRFSGALVADAAPIDATEAGVTWRFDEVDSEPEATGGWRALHGVEGLAVRDGRLVGRTAEKALLVASVPPGPWTEDLLHAVEVRMRASAGSRLGVFYWDEEELDDSEAVEDLLDASLPDLTVDLAPGEELRTYTLTPSDSTFSASFPLASIRHLVLHPTDAAGADIEIESVRLVSRREHLASVPSGIGWHGLGEVYRETLVGRAPERFVFRLDLPSDPWLDLAIGTLDRAPVTFRVSARQAGGGTEEVLLRRTVTTPDRWEEASVDLGAFARRGVELILALEAEEAGTLGFWGGPVVRSRGRRAPGVEPDAALAALAGPAPPTPRAVIVILADTLRRDHLPIYGYERDTAPTLTRLAREGTVFEDAISQGSWTKVASASLLTGLYATTHGLVDMPDRLPASATTLAECFRGAGYATFATSSVPFSGKLSNLQQGVDVFLERGAIQGGFLAPKTARPFVDRLLEWLEPRTEGPLFALLHVFDPHSPFEPGEPWTTRWMDPRELAEHREDMDRVREVIDNDFMKRQALPTREELETSGVDEETYLAREKAWYDASIRAMDAEIARLLERLEELGLARDTLVAFVSDHGEEFLEHGRHFHGYTAYGEMLNVPLLLWWPGVVPAGVRVPRTVETIDLFPTLLALSRVEVPPAVQGQSLLPLLVPGASPEELGWSTGPVFSERRIAPAAFSEDREPVTSLVVIEDRWKLVWNVERPEGRPEHELYDHRADPLNLVDLAGENPELVERLAAHLVTWQEEAEAARVELGAEARELSEEDLEHLRALGYAR